MSNLYQDLKGQIKLTPRTTAQVINLNQPPKPEEISANLHRHQQSLLSQRSIIGLNGPVSSSSTSAITNATSSVLARSAPDLPGARRGNPPPNLSTNTVDRSQSYHGTLSDFSDFYRLPPVYPGNRRASGVTGPVYENYPQTGGGNSTHPVTTSSFPGHPPAVSMSATPLPSGASVSMLDYLRQSPRSSLSSDSSPRESVLEAPPAYPGHSKPPQPLPGQPPVYANLAELKKAIVPSPPPPPYKPAPVKKRIEELEKEFRAPRGGVAGPGPCGETISSLGLSLAGLSLPSGCKTEQNPSLQAVHSSPSRDCPPPAPAPPSPCPHEGSAGLPLPPPPPYPGGPHPVHISSVPAGHSGQSSIGGINNRVATNAFGGYNAAVMADSTTPRDMSPKSGHGVVSSHLSTGLSARVQAQSVQDKLERMTREIEEEMERQAPDGEFFGKQHEMYMLVICVWYWIM